MKTPSCSESSSDSLTMPRTARQYGFAHQDSLRVHVRNFMELDLADGASLPPGKLGFSALIDSWSERKQDEAASLIPTAYQGHIDSEIDESSIRLPRRSAPFSC